MEYLRDLESDNDTPQGFLKKLCYDKKQQRKRVAWDVPVGSPMTPHIQKGEIKMDKGQMKLLGIVCLVICAICVFVAFERYQNNANNVQAINQFQNSSPLGGMMSEMTGQAQMKPATPAATKYAIVFALIAGAGGAVLLTKSRGNLDPQQRGPSDF